jgi:hypothetical protein
MAAPETHYRTDWRNVGLWRQGAHGGIMTPWGNLNVKPWADRLFSERHGSTPHRRLFGLCISWVRLRHFRNLSEAISDIEPQETPLMRHLKARPIPGSKEKS